MKAAPVAALASFAGLVAAAASPAPTCVPNTIDFLSGSAIVAHWPASAFPIATRVTRGLTNDVPAADARAALDSAMATWSASPDSTVEIFVEAEQGGGWRPTYLTESTSSSFPTTQRSTMPSS